MSAPKELHKRQLGLSTAATALALVLAACGAPEVDIDDVDETYSEICSENALTTNALTTNALTSNALTSNALTSNALTSNALTSNALTSNALRSTTMHSSGVSSGHLSCELLKYVVRCALTSSQTVTVTCATSSGSGVTSRTFTGKLGLAPYWRTSYASTSDQKWVSGCVAAHINKWGVPVDISLRGNYLSGYGLPHNPGLYWSDSEEYTYDNREGAFWGNLWQKDSDGDPDPWIYSCFATTAGINRSCTKEDCGLLKTQSLGGSSLKHCYNNLICNNYGHVVAGEPLFYESCDDDRFNQRSDRANYVVTAWQR